MLFPFLPLDPSVWTLRYLSADDARVTLVLRSAAPTACCPLCRHPAQRVHSRYVRRLADLPWQDRAVLLRLEVRRFVCTAAACPRRIFAERLPELATPYARTTLRLRATHSAIGFALGGEAGARLAGQLAMRTSPDTLLRRIRQAPLSGGPAPRVLGVDDWAWCKGTRYGTILCDLERRRVVDLLPDRSAETLVDWLRAHPGIEVISRDRAGVYAQAARLGAPDAVQVVDRWHLLKNLREAVERLLDRKRTDIRAAAEAANSATTSSHAEAAPMRPRRKEMARQARRARRLERYNRVVELSRQGLSYQQIARQTGLCRDTVAHYVRTSNFPERASPRRRHRVPRPVDAYAAYIQRRRAEGCLNVMQITRELVAQGHPVSYGQVQRHIGTRRPRVKPSQPAPAAAPSPRQVSWLLLRPSSEVPLKERAFVAELCRGSPEVEQVAQRAQAFAALVRRREAAALEEWLRQAQADKVPRELRSFAAALEQDQAAVRAALELPWSNGPVEGAINRLKLLKRQMYNRARLDLLRQRVVHQN